MNAFFLALLNMSITASWLILAVLLLRLLFKKASKVIRCVLWGMVAVRLICPFSPESRFSLIPSAETLPPQIVQVDAPGFRVNTGLPPIDTLINNTLDNRYYEGVTVPSNTGSNLMSVLGWIWLAGAAILLLYMIVASLRLRKKVSAAMPLQDNIWLCDSIRQPFILGIIKPRIYLPSDMGEEQRGYVIVHERAHLKRRDHWWKPLGFLLLAIYWFNPLCWFSYILFCRDIELACDEHTLKKLGLESKKPYSEALMACSMPSRMLIGSPLAFGEVSVKERIKAVLNYKKPAFWITAAAVLACIVIVVCFLTNPTKTGGGAPVIPVDKPPAESTPEQPPAESTLDENTAAQFIDQTLNTLVVNTDHTVSFSLPELIPVAAGENPELLITLTAAFSPEPGTYAVQRLLDSQGGWNGGDSYTGVLEVGKGQLNNIMLRVAFMTQITPNQYQEYKANYVELHAPFDYGNPAVAQEPSAVVTASGQQATLRYRLQNGDWLEVALQLPEGLTLTAEDMAGADDAALPPPVAARMNGRIIGELRCYPIGTADEETLRAIDTAANLLPMPVFSYVALANHAGYEDYQVQKHSASGAAATAKYTWQDLNGDAALAAAEIPWQSLDCILVYDWQAMPYYLEFALGDGIFTEEQLSALAQSIRITAAGA